LARRQTEAAERNPARLGEATRQQHQGYHYSKGRDRPPARIGPLWSAPTRRRGHSWLQPAPFSFDSVLLRQQGTEDERAGEWNDREKPDRGPKTRNRWMEDRSRFTGRRLSLMPDGGPLFGSNTGHAFEGKSGHCRGSRRQPYRRALENRTPGPWATTHIQASPRGLKASKARRFEAGRHLFCERSGCGPQSFLRFCMR